MTTIYFVRHAQRDFANHNDALTGLSEKGMRDRLLVTRYLSDKNIDAVLSSPYNRAVYTVQDFADKNGLPVITVEDLRERKVGGQWIDDFEDFCKRQWSDFDFKLEEGESLREVQDRNVCALDQILHDYNGKTIAIGTHGTALSSIIHHYDPSYGYADFEQIRYLMPWIVKFTFNGKTCTEIEKINVFKIKRTE